jgi:hypothetical protein
VSSRRNTSPGPSPGPNIGGEPSYDPAIHIRLPAVWIWAPRSSSKDMLARICGMVFSSVVHAWTCTV